ncbi:MAG: hypothetical protein K0R50_804 [Eubacterium sp.]|nr:hypothetical protein [Eubacterium sp.]
MLIDMDITIAYKCFSCGTFDFTRINLFKLFSGENIESVCKCGIARLKIFDSAKDEYILSVPCIGCGSTHRHIMRRDSLLSNNIIIYTCPITGIKNCFIGKDVFVRKFIDNFEKELDGIIDGLGYDSYFDNTRVMLDTLNKIHDIAEKGELYCECGSNDITVSMLRKGIALKCADCNRTKFIPASNNNDLKKILQKDRIILLSKKSKYKIPN